MNGIQMPPSSPREQSMQPSAPGAYPEMSNDAARPPDAGQRAADMMSPVGPQYPDRDWEAAAAVQVRTLPPWMLAILFVGAIGIALALTVVIAAIVR